MFVVVISASVVAVGRSGDDCEGDVDVVDPPVGTFPPVSAFPSRFDLTLTLSVRLGRSVSLGGVLGCHSISLTRTPCPLSQRANGNSHCSTARSFP